MQWCCLPHLYLSRLSADGECFEINCWYGAALGTTACVSTSGSYKINSLYCVEFWSHFHSASSNPGLWLGSGAGSWWRRYMTVWWSGDHSCTPCIFRTIHIYINWSLLVARRVQRPASRRPQLTIFHGSSASIGSVPPVTVTIVRYLGWPHRPYTVYTHMDD